VGTAVPRPAYQYYRPSYPYYRPYYRPYYPYYGYGYPYYGYGYPYYGYGYPFYGASFYYGAGWGVGFGLGWGWPTYYQYPYPPYGYGGVYEAGCDLRVQVTPRDAEVYMDGYLVGSVDDFDGTWQRLRVAYGDHEITVHKEGYRQIKQRMLFRPGENYRIRETMQPIAPGDPQDPRPLPPEQPQNQGQAQNQGPPPDQGYPRGRVQVPPPQRPEGPPPQRQDRGAFGTIAIRVQPADAEILIDGQRWERPAGDDRLSVELNEGMHRIEIRKPGFRPYTTNIEVRRGETAPLNVSLPPGESRLLGVQGSPEPVARRVVVLR
jgi:hypothetical protein